MSYTQQQIQSIQDLLTKVDSLYNVGDPKLKELIATALNKSCTDDEVYQDINTVIYHLENLKNSVSTFMNEELAHIYNSNRWKLQDKIFRQGNRLFKIRDIEHLSKSFDNTIEHNTQVIISAETISSYEKNGFVYTLYKEYDTFGIGMWFIINYEKYLCDDNDIKVFNDFVNSSKNINKLL